MEESQAVEGDNGFNYRGPAFLRDVLRRLTEKMASSGKLEVQNKPCVSGKSTLGDGTRMCRGPESKFKDNNNRKKEQKRVLSRRSGVGRHMWGGGRVWGYFGNSDLCLSKSVVYTNKKEKQY